MQSSFLQIDRKAFDWELASSDAYGESLIICNFFTYSLLVENFDLDERKLLGRDCLDYKGHEVYINPNYKDFEYKVFPKQVSIERLKSLKDFRRYELMEEEDENAE